MTKPGEPEMRPGFAGERVHLADLAVGDVLDLWHRRSGGFFLRENVVVQSIDDDGKVRCRGGLVLLRDASWGEIRRKEQV